MALVLKEGKDDLEVPEDENEGVVDLNNASGSRK
jgi:hypothetical protein